MRVVLAVQKFDYDEIAEKAYIFDSWQSMIRWAKRIGDKVGEEGSFRIECNDDKTELQLSINGQSHYFDIVDKEIIEV